VPQRRGADTLFTGLLDRSALYGVLAEAKALGLDLVEVRQLTPDTAFTRIRRRPLTVMSANFGALQPCYQKVTLR
jgi:hypothetical protein